MYSSNTVHVGGIPQQQQVIIRQAAPSAPDEFKPGAASQMKALGGVQIALGLLCIICGIVMISLEGNEYGQGNEISSIGYGIWMGVIILLLGIMGIAAAKSKTCMITATMILNIIFCAGGTLTIMTMTGIGLVLTSINSCYNTYYTTTEWVDGETVCTKTCDWYYDWGCGFDGCAQYGWKPGHYQVVTNSGYDCNGQRVSSVYYAMDSVILICGFVEFIIAVWISALCCGAVCQCCKTTVVPQMVSYHVQPTGMTATPMIFSTSTSQQMTTTQMPAQNYFPQAQLMQPYGYGQQQQQPGYFQQQHGQIPVPQQAATAPAGAHHMPSTAQLYPNQAGPSGMPVPPPYSAASGGKDLY